jgi:beta-galactosidase
VTFGVRSAVVDLDKGFFQNGKSLKLQGISSHEDHAGVGMEKRTVAKTRQLN